MSRAKRLQTAGAASAAFALIAFGTPLLAQIKPTEPIQAPRTDPSPIQQPGRAGPPEPTFTYRVCNQTSREVRVALAMRTDPEKPDEWTIAGWWTVAVSACNNLAKPVWGWLYLFAEGYHADGRPTFWPIQDNKREDDTTFCVQYPGPFERRHSRDHTCERRLLKQFWGMNMQPHYGLLITTTIRIVNK